MPSRRRDQMDIVDSDSEDDDQIENQNPEFHQAKHVIKNRGAATLANSDNWPCIDIKGTFCFTKDGKIGNILEAGLSRGFIAQGVLHADDVQAKRLLVNKSANGSHIEADVDSFSIGFGPTTLWAGGPQAIWWQLRPEPAYKPMYIQMVDAIRVFYTLLNAHEFDLKLLGRDMAIEEIFQVILDKDGAGMTKKTLSQFLSKHAFFLISHMTRPGQIDWAKTTFYKWLVATHKNMIGAIQVNSGSKIKIPPLVQAKSLPYGPPPPSRDSTPEFRFVRSANEALMPSIETSHPLSKIASKTEVNTPPPFDFPGLDFHEHPQEIIRALEKARSEKAKWQQNIGIKSVATILYFDYSIPYRSIAMHMLNIHAAAIFEGLDPTWRNSKLAMELKEEVRNPTQPPSLSDTEAYEHYQKAFVIKLKLRGKKNRRVKTEVEAEVVVNIKRTAHEISPKPAKPQNRTRKEQRRIEEKVKYEAITSRSRTTTTPEPSSTKTILPPMSAKLSGKISGLRPLGSSRKRTREHNFDEDVIMQDAFADRHQSSDSSASSDSTNLIEPTLPEDYKGYNTGSTQQPQEERSVVTSYRLAPEQPGFYGSVRVCEFKMDSKPCTFQLLSSEPVSLWDEHIEEHKRKLMTAEQLAAIELIEKESSRTNIRAGFLADKVKGFGLSQDQAPHQMIHGKPIPTRAIRRYL